MTYITISIYVLWHHYITLNTFQEHAYYQESIIAMDYSLLLRFKNCPGTMSWSLGLTERQSSIIIFTRNIFNFIFLLGQGSYGIF